MNGKNYLRHCYALLCNFSIRRLCLILTLFTLSLSYGQIGTIWYFGEYAGLDFNSGAPVPVTDSAMYTIEGCATLTNTDGTIMFYTNGQTVWNKNHQIMSNGDGLLGNESSIQAAVIVPKPDSNTIFYIFTTEAPGYSGIIDGFNYSEVDMSLDGGLGAVTSNKNIQLLTASTEQLAMVKHDNGIDYWVITHGHPNDIVYAFLVTAAGITTTPVATNVGLNITHTGDIVGSLKVSPDGSRLAFTNMMTGAQLMDFDRATGIASNPQTIITTEMLYSLEFSLSGKRLYGCYTQFGVLLQFDLEAADIPGSVITLFTGEFEERGGVLQRGPNGKIYYAMHNKPAISVISNPDALGTACNFEHDAIDLAGKISLSGLPTPTQLVANVVIKADNVCQGDATTFSLEPATASNTVAWDFGDGSSSNEINPLHVYETAGEYNVSATFMANGTYQTIFRTITVLETPFAIQPPDLTECSDENGNAEFNLQPQKEIILGSQFQTDFYVSFFTSLEDAHLGINFISEEFTPTTNPQTIYARVSPDAGVCHAVTSFELNIIPKPVINMPDAYAFCKGNTVTLAAPPGFDSYEWSTGSTSQSIVVSEAGNYTLKVTKQEGDVTCEAEKTVTVTESLRPEIVDLEITDWTDNNNSIVVRVSGIGNYRYSIDGINYQESPVFTGLPIGRYTVYVKDIDGCGSDDQTTVLLMYPKFFTPNADGQNEIWDIKYAYFEPDLKVHIYDRYGKLLHSFRGNEPGWDGTYNGNHLPASDYWFIVTRNNGKEYKGHFSMLR